MNRLINQQRLQAIEFYYQNACSVKKVHRALLPFYAQFNRSAEVAIRAIVTKFRTKFTRHIARVTMDLFGEHLIHVRQRSIGRQDCAV